MLELLINVTGIKSTKLGLPMIPINGTILYIPYNDITMLIRIILKFI